MVINLERLVALGELRLRNVSQPHRANEQSFNVPDYGSWLAYSDPRQIAKFANVELILTLQDFLETKP